MKDIWLKFRYVYMMHWLFLAFATVFFMGGAIVMNLADRSISLHVVSKYSCHLK